MTLASSLTLYSATTLSDALQLPASTVRAFFEGKAFGDWKKFREAESKMQAGIADRLNNVIRACDIIAKTVAKTR